MAKKATAEKTADKSAPRNKAGVKRASANSTAKQATAKQAAPKKAPAKKAPAKKAPRTATKAPVKKRTAKKASPKKAVSKKATTSTKKTVAKKAPAKAAASSRTNVGKADDARAAEEQRLVVYRKTASKAFNKPFLKKQRAMLDAEREKYTRSAASYKAEAESLVLDREPGDVQFDEESGEGDTLAVERERDLALSAQAQHAVNEIDGALKRLDDGVYGVCVESGKPIPKDRLVAIPWATQRVEYKVGGLGRR